MGKGVGKEIILNSYIMHEDIQLINTYNILFVHMYTYTQMCNMLYTWLDFENIFQESVWQLVK